MKTMVFPGEIVSEELRLSLSKFAEGIHNLHRTGPWKHVYKYIVTFKDGSSVTHYSYADRPIYAACCECDGKKKWIVLQPKHKQRENRFFFVDREGGEQ